MNKLKVWIRRFIARHFGYFVENLLAFKIKFTSFANPPIIILTPGKVGSSSVYYTLKNKLDHPVFHIHRLSENGIKDSVDEHLQSDRNSRPLHLIVSNLLRNKLQKYKGPRYVISIIREPISRAVSAFFQNTECYKSEIENGILEINNQKALKLLSDKLNHNIIRDLEDWFTKEIEGNLGINVFEESFSQPNGYHIKRKGKVHFMLLQMESLDHVFPEAIQEFLNLPEAIKLEKANIGAEKHYSDSYKEVKQEITIDKKELDRIINSRFFQKFYSDHAEAVMNKWGED